MAAGLMMIALPATGSASEAVDKTRKAAIGFCLAVLEREENPRPALIANDIGAVQQVDLLPAQKKWIDQQAWVTEAGPKWYYGLSLKKGVLLFNAQKLDGASLCFLTLFDVMPNEGDAAFRMLDDFYQMRGFKRYPKTDVAWEEAVAFRGLHGTI